LQEAKLVNPVRKVRADHEKYLGLGHPPPVTPVVLFVVLFFWE